MTIPIFLLPIIAIMKILESMPDLEMLSRTSNRIKRLVEDSSHEVRRSQPRLKLLEVPLLIGTEVLRSMGFLNLFVLAHTSKLMRNIIRREIKVRSHNLAIFLQPGTFLFQLKKIGTEEESSISVRRDARIHPDGDHFYQRIGNFDVQSTLQQLESPHLVTHWTSVFTGMKEMYGEISFIFRIPIHKIYIDLNSVGKRCKPVIDWINSISSEIPLVQISGDNCSFELYCWVFDHLRSSKQVHFLSKPAEFSAKEAHCITHDDILIKYGEWVKLEHLKLMECRCIHIENSAITDKEINEFLRGLITGSNPNLRKLVFGMARDSDVDVVFAELDSNQIDENKWSFRLENGMDCIVQNVAYEDDEQQGIEIEIVKNKETKEI